MMLQSANGEIVVQPVSHWPKNLDPSLFLGNNENQFYSRTWRTVDDRFFFNKALIQELIDLNDTRADAWIVPFIQGFVEIQECPLGN